MAKPPAGRVTLRLRARDSLGRAVVATRKLVVTPVALQRRVLRVPDRVRARASSLPVSLATTVPATVRVGSRSFAVGARTRKLRIPLPSRPKTGILRLRATLTAVGARQRRLRQTLIVLRG
jgi:hypothetical protein